MTMLNLANNYLYSINRDLSFQINEKMSLIILGVSNNETSKKATNTSF